jgi:hypothetical protein
VAPQGSVTGVDLSPGMIEVAGHLELPEGCAPIEYLVGAAEDLPMQARSRASDDHGKAGKLTTSGSCDTAQHGAARMLLAHAAFSYRPRAPLSRAGWDRDKMLARRRSAGVDHRSRLAARESRPSR